MHGGLYGDVSNVHTADYVASVYHREGGNFVVLIDRIERRRPCPEAGNFLNFKVSNRYFVLLKRFRCKK
jgi:hypothetical protein